MILEETRAMEQLRNDKILTRMNGNNKGDEGNRKELQFKDYQERFILSKARHPCFIGGWGVGKTLGAIWRSRIYSEMIPDNLGIIFRKTFKSLSDSTLKDFELQTGLKVDSERNLYDGNGSITMFRHIDEIGSINQQNINLGWFYIEQGEELEDSNAFHMLFGRLRRNVEPSMEFRKLGLAWNSGWVIGNAGDTWMKPLWKDGELARSAEGIEFSGPFTELIEATTWDNAENLNKEFLASLHVLERTNLPMYRQFVMNDWSVTRRNRVFTSELISHMQSRYGMIASHVRECGVAVDPAGEGADNNIFMVADGGEPVETFEKTIMSPTEKAIKAVEMAHRHGAYFIVIDCDGIGIETYSELTRLPENYLAGIEIVKFHGSAPSAKEMLGRRMYENTRCEAAFIAQKRGWDGKASVHKDARDLIKQLEADEYFTNRKGYLQIIPKEDIKVKLGVSPGLADSWKMLQWGFEQGIERKINPLRNRYLFNPEINLVEQYQTVNVTQDYFGKDVA